MRIRAVLLSSLLSIGPFVLILCPLLVADWSETTLQAESLGSRRPLPASYVRAPPSVPTDTHPVETTNPEPEPPTSTGEAPSDASNPHLARADISVNSPSVPESPDRTMLPPETVSPMELEPQNLLDFDEVLRLAESSIDVEEVQETCVQSDPDQRHYGPMIEQRADGSTAVPRAMLSFYATHPGRLRLLGDTWTHRVDGESIGFRVRPTDCSILLDAGFETNDVILGINGFRVSTLFEAVRTYLRLIDAEAYDVEILRGEDRFVRTFVPTQTSSSVADNSSRRERRLERRRDRRDRRMTNRVGVELAQQGERADR